VVYVAACALQSNYRAEGCITQNFLDPGNLPNTEKDWEMLLSALEQVTVMHEHHAVEGGVKCSDA
jgi:hypothetical protein